MSTYRSAVAKLQNFINVSKLNIIDELVVEHYFAHGTYTRIMYIPEGLLVIGKIHRYTTMNLMIQGRLQLINEDETISYLTAPNFFVSEPNTKKTVYTLEPTIFANTHPWDGKKTLAEIEDEVIIPEYIELEATPCPGELSRQ